MYNLEERIQHTYSVSIGSEKLFKPATTEHTDMERSPLNKMGTMIRPCDMDMIQ
jgi:hypothetical protein